MNRTLLYPLSTWLLWVIVIPLTVVGLGVLLVITTDIGDLPLDNPDLWWIVGAVPLAGLVYLYGVSCRRRAFEKFASGRLAPLLAVRVSPTRQAIRAALCILAIAMLSAALLGPRWGVYVERQKVHGVDIVVAVDLSRSMLAADVEPNRLERAKREIRQQLTERAVFQRAHRLALLAFAGSTSLRLPLTTDHLAFRSKLEELAVGSIPRGGTAIAAALQDSADLFARSPEEATKVILLFTDGEDHEGGAADTARRIHDEQGITVFPIGVGDPTRSVGAEVPVGGAAGPKPLLYDGQIVFSKLAVEGLRRIAEAGQGRWVLINDLHALVDEISNMWQTELTTEQRKKHKPRYQWFVMLALALLGLEMLIGDGKAVADEPRRVWQVENSL
ncbi:MAG: VWA domain-containing protein [Phycisphaerae bacterium]